MYQEKYQENKPVFTRDTCKYTSHKHTHTHTHTHTRTHTRMHTMHNGWSLYADCNLAVPGQFNSASVK